METKTGEAREVMTESLTDVVTTATIVATTATVDDRLYRLEKQVQAILGVMGWMDLKAKPEAQKALKALKDCLTTLE